MPPVPRPPVDAARSAPALSSWRSLVAADSAVDSRHDQSFTRGRCSAQADRPGLMSLFADNCRSAHSRFVEARDDNFRGRLRI